MIFEKELLRDIVNGDHKQYKVLKETVTETKRWSNVMECVFASIEDGRIFLTYYERDATDMQDSEPYEYDGDFITCSELTRTTREIEVWESEDGESYIEAI